MELSTTITDNICQQIIAFQNSIFAREEGQQFPNKQEVDMLCRMVNCLDKLRKFAAQSQANKALTGFISFIKKEDKALGATVKDIYQDYIAAKPATGLQPLASDNDNEEEEEPFIPTDTPPVTFADFEKYKDEVAVTGYNEESVIDFNNQEVNAQWLQYNLFQFYLRESERKFFFYENEYHYRIQHRKEQNRINSFLKDKGIPQKQYTPPAYRKAS